MLAPSVRHFDLRRDWPLACVAVAALLVIGLNLAWEARVHRLPTWDQAHHLTLGIHYARSMTAHTFWRQFTAVPENYPPGLHVLLGLATLAVGPRASLGLIVNLAGTVLLLTSTYAVGVRWMGRTAGAYAATLTAVTPGLVVFSREALSEYWIAALTVAAMRALVASDECRRPVVSALFGIACGVGLLFKPTLAFALWLPVLIVAGAALRRRGWGSLGNLAIAAALAIGIAAVWYRPQWANVMNLWRINEADAQQSDMSGA